MAAVGSQRDRAFANKLSKRGAAEVRKQVSSTYLGDSTKNATGINVLLTAQQNTPLCDIVEPLDFEDFVALYQNIIDRDPLHHILEFPTDDVQQLLICRKVRTLAPVIPDRGYETDRHVRDCVRCYTKDYVNIIRRYENCCSQHLNKDIRARRLQSVTRQLYEIHAASNDSEASCDRNPSNKNPAEVSNANWANSNLDLTNSDPLISTLLVSTHLDVTDAINRSERQKNRQDALFSLYPHQSEEDLIENRQQIFPPTEHLYHRVLVKCLQLRLELEIEPIFSSMALYSVKERKKISENFYFDMTSEPLKKMLEAHIPYQDVSSLSRSCIFHLTHPSPDIFLVIRLEKVLQQGDISEAAEPYMKDEKSRERARTNAAFYCEKLGRYRMPFAWTAVHLMSVINSANTLDLEKEQQSRSDVLEPSRGTTSSAFSPYDSFRKSSLDRPKSGTPDKRDSWNIEDVGGALDSFRPVTLTISSFFKQEADKLSDDDLYKFLVELKRPAFALKKLRCIPGTLKLDISPCPAEVKNCLTPELYKVDPYSDDNIRPIKEVVEFPIKEVYEPFTAYRNLLYVSPKLLSFASRQGSARNLAVKVSVMEGEDDVHAMNVIFGKSSCPEFCREMYTTVCYHNRTPSFYDEVKIRLPAKLADGHHLLFTFYHISCQRKMDMSTALESVVGYTWLPLLRDGRLQTGEFSLPVSIEKPPAHYSMLHPDVQLPNMKWVDNHKGLFSVVIDAVSSLHPLDEYLDRFLSLVHAAEECSIPPRIGEANFEAELKQSISDITQSRNGPLIRFLPLVLDKLLLLMVRPPIIAGQVGLTHNVLAFYLLMVVCCSG